MQYDLTLIYGNGNESRLERIIFDRRWEIRREEPTIIYDTRYAHKLAQNVPNYIYSDGIQNLIKNIWKN